jgi:hypothetical protein
LHHINIFFCCGGCKIIKWVTKCMHRITTLMYVWSVVSSRFSFHEYCLVTGINSYGRLFHQNMTFENISCDFRVVWSQWRLHGCVIWCMPGSLMMSSWGLPNMIWWVGYLISGRNFPMKFLGHFHTPTSSCNVPPIVVKL